jgi:hypothetical protein
MSDVKIHNFQLADTILRDDSPHSKYKETGELTKNIHDGQMKMLLADDMGITNGLLHICSQYKKNIGNIKHRGTKIAVIVVGAATGEHFFGLSNTFHFLDFVLYDPAPYGWSAALLSKSRQDKTNVKIHTSFFKPETAEEWVKNCQYEHVIFLCDLRTGDGYVDAEIIRDMQLQKELTVKVNAAYSVLKFRPPYYRPHLFSTHFYRYLDGTTYFQAYAPRNSSETRLHVTNIHSTKTYDTGLYENQLFYHNQVTRNESINLFQTKGDPRCLMYDNTYALFVKEYMLQQLRLRVADAHVRAYDHDDHDVPDSGKYRRDSSESESESEPDRLSPPESERLSTLLRTWNQGIIDKIHSYTESQNERVNVDLQKNKWLHGSGVDDQHVRGICGLISETVLDLSEFLVSQKYKPVDCARVGHRLEEINLFVLTLQSCIRESTKNMAQKYTHDFQIFYVSFAFAVWTDLDTITELETLMRNLYTCCNMLYVYIRYRLCLATLVDDYLTDDTSMQKYHVLMDVLPEITEYENTRPHYDSQMRLTGNVRNTEKPPRRRTGNRHTARELSPEHYKHHVQKNPNAYVPPSRQGGYVPKNIPKDTKDSKHSAYVPPHQRKNYTRKGGPPAKATEKT